MTAESASWRSLNILSVGYPLFPVRDGSGGGAEQILGIMDRALMRAGHRSTVIAAAGSSVEGRLIETPGAGQQLTETARQAAQQVHRACIAEVLRGSPPDLIHFHGLDFLEYQPPQSEVPQLVTLHLPIDWYPADSFDASGVAFNCVSRSQSRTHPAGHLLAVVCNGIELNSFLFSDTKQDFLLWLGRICPEKGPDIALRVAHCLDLPLILAGPVHLFEAHLNYFAQQVEPLLDSKRRYVGAVDKNQRASLLSNASCLLIPALAAETSSLVAMEAACSGTPVVAFRSGALPEIVEDQITGFLSSSEEEMAQQVERTKGISPFVCREVAEKRFSSDRMFRDYLSLYYSLVSSR